jgi:hypothetical protein
MTGHRIHGSVPLTALRFREGTGSSANVEEGTSAAASACENPKLETTGDIRDITHSDV